MASKYGIQPEFRGTYGPFDVTRRWFDSRGLLTEHDADGALLMKTLVVALTAAAVGTALAGDLFANFGPALFSLFNIAAVAVAAGGALRIFKAQEA